MHGKVGVKGLKLKMLFFYLVDHICCDYFSILKVACSLLNSLTKIIKIALKNEYNYI